MPKTASKAGAKASANKTLPLAQHLTSQMESAIRGWESAGAPPIQGSRNLSVGKSLTLASMKKVYRVDQVTAELQRAPENNALLRRTLEKLIAREGERFAIRPAGLSALDPVYEACPNFTPVLDELRKMLALSVSGDEPLSFLPVLLAGDPGVGKTHFAKELASALGTGYEFVSLASATASFLMTGASPGWAGARNGKVAHAIVEGTVSNPVMVLDEIDKAGGDSRYDVMGSFYQLLERDTATHFKDEFLGEIEFDVSGFLWVATANDLSRIPGPILDRMAVFEVRKPSPEEARHIARRIYAQLLADHRWGIEGDMPQDVQAVCEKIPPREMKKQIISAMGAARVQKRCSLSPDDFGTGNGKKSQSMGFLA